MTAQVHDIADQRPHLVVVASDGAHVLPVELFRSIIAGEKPSSILTEPVVCRIIEEWLKRVTA
ncbi:hypothetical protein [Pseudomonas caricapapayae]|uniref:hypothetical protein n=1 Tax=Pseudomonas caricapapayae TaxID=46678 RepID=UPI0006D5FDFA|nr:hypothetical protein [Pseudomonas caricapapayae]KAA8689578.1 hypothetical protein F4W67_27520 [Pseudomonas caricapapayae]